MEEDEVAIPDDEVEVGVNGTATSGGYAPSQALALLATAPGHDHRQRNLAGSPNAGELSKFAELPPAGPAEVLDCRDLDEEESARPAWRVYQDLSEKFDQPNAKSIE
eukprot:g28636.t1